MKIDEKTALCKEQIEICIKKQQESEYKLLGRMRIIPGLTLYSFDYRNLILEEVKIKHEISIDLDMREHKHDKVIAEKHCIYFQVHNLRAAIRKVNQIIYKTTGKRNIFYLSGKEIKANIKAL